LQLTAPARRVGARGGVRSIRLLSSSRHNYVGLAGFGIEITETEGLEG
jgi:GTP cyclohydrolase II